MRQCTAPFRKILAVITMAGCLSAAAACGSTTRAAFLTAVNVVSGAEAATTGAGTAHFSGTTTIGDRTIQADGTVDLRKRLGQLTETLPKLGKVEVLQDGVVAYIKLPAATAAVLGKPWVKFDSAALDQQVTGVDAASLVGDGSGPLEGLAWLKGAGNDFHQVGSEAIRGSTTTHYAGTVDLAQAAAAETDPARRQALQQEAKLFGVAALAVNVWIDGSGRIAQMRYAVEASKMRLPSGAAPGTGMLETTRTFFDFGTPFTMPSLPSTDQTTDIGPLLAAEAAAAAAAASAAPGGSTGVTPEKAAALAEQLGKLVVAPPGFVPWAEVGVTNGPLDATAFDRDWGKPGLAEKVGLVSGYDETFRYAGTNSLDVTLFQFATPAQAAAFLQILNLARAGGRTSSSFRPIPAAFTISFAQGSDGTYEHDIVAAKGPRLMQVAYTSFDPGLPAVLSGLAVRLYQSM